MGDEQWTSDTNHISIVFWADKALAMLGFELRITAKSSESIGPSISEKTMIKLIFLQNMAV